MMAIEGWKKARARWAAESAGEKEAIVVARCAAKREPSVPN